MKMNENENEKVMLEKIKKYIENTKMHRLPIGTGLNCSELFAFSHNSHDEPFEALVIAFEYGRAKGYRAAKAEQKRRKMM